MSRKTTLYDILGVGSSATIEQIKAAFRRLALVHHPDRNCNSEESTARFRVLRNAYDILSDDARRLEYNAFLGSRGTPGSIQDPVVPGDSGAGRLLAGTTDDVAAVLSHLNYVLWDIEDLIRSEPDWTAEFDGVPLQRHVENMLRFIDRWVLTPAGFPDYFYQARNMAPPPGFGGLAPPLGRSVCAHSPFVRVSDYFYHIRLRVDKLLQHAKLSDLLRPIPNTDLRLIDSVLEAHNYCVHYLSHLKRCLRGEAQTVPEFRHTIRWVADNDA